MGKAAYSDRYCRRCGYLFSPFETDCPRCARLPAAPPASGPAADRPDVHQRPVGSRRKLDVGAIALTVAAAIAFYAGTMIVIVGASGSGSRDASYWWCLAIGLLFYTALGYPLSIPEVRRDMWQSVQPRTTWGLICDVVFLAAVPPTVLGLLLLAWVIEGEESLAGSALVMLIAGPFYTLASALLSHLLRTRLRRHVGRQG